MKRRIGALHSCLERGTSCCRSLRDAREKLLALLLPLPTEVNVRRVVVCTHVVPSIEPMDSRKLLLVKNALAPRSNTLRGDVGLVISAWSVRIGHDPRSIETEPRAARRER